MKAPFPYFGGKARVAPIVWQLLGNPKHYIEPFFGSGAVLLNRPGWKPDMVETVNDKCGHIANVWRSIQFNPDETAKWADWPVNHADLSARRKVLIANNEYLIERLSEDPDYYDAKLAGYWIWAASCWIGSGLTKIDAIPSVSKNSKGVHSKIPDISRFPYGINSQRPILYNYSGVHSKRPKLTGNGGSGVNKTSVQNGKIYEWFSALSERLRRVRVICGDWTRVCGGNWQDDLGVCGIFFDPPYGEMAKRKKGLYAHDSFSISEDVRIWARARAYKASYRIVIAGYYEEHESLLSEGWRVYRWKSNGGYANIGHGPGENNKSREALFFSPHCRSLDQPELFDTIK